MEKAAAVEASFSAGLLEGLVDLEDDEEEGDDGDGDDAVRIIRRREKVIV